jgi:hypothetical protein
MVGEWANFSSRLTGCLFCKHRLMSWRFHRAAPIKKAHTGALEDGIRSAAKKFYPEKSAGWREIRKCDGHHSLTGMALALKASLWAVV